MKHLTKGPWPIPALPQQPDQGSGHRFQGRRSLCMMVVSMADCVLTGWLAYSGSFGSS